jgi:hypothetical protein
VKDVARLGRCGFARGRETWIGRPVRSRHSLTP